ncbi:MAG: ABC transporter ATP-binding protein [Deltaproteobacteria bacterium]|nr:ABC transporter ATP-binding protein [Deltaproteobacteria bacterium]
MLEVKGISVKYNIIKVLHDLSFKIEQGQMIAMVGSNAAGKSTVLKTISGLLHPVEGSIEFMDERIDNMAPFEITSRGISHVPEGRKIFSKLTVEENLLIGAHVRVSKQEVDRSLEEMFNLFSMLKERREQKGETLSGGEQQMLAIARGLMSKPRLLMLDEPSLGLSPILSHKVIEICKEIRSKGTTILLVEQKVKDALEIADWAYVLQTGRIAMEGAGSELLLNEKIRKAYLGL